MGTSSLSIVSVHVGVLIILEHRCPVKLPERIDDAGICVVTSKVSEAFGPSAEA